MKIFVTESTSPAPGSFSRFLGSDDKGIYAESELELSAFERLSNFVAILNRRGNAPADAAIGLYQQDDALFVSKRVLDYDKVRGWYIKPHLSRKIWDELCAGEKNYREYEKKGITIR